MQLNLINYVLENGRNPSLLSRYIMQWKRIIIILIFPALFLHVMKRMIYKTLCADAHEPEKLCPWMWWYLACYQDLSLPILRLQFILDVIICNGQGNGRHDVIIKKDAVQSFHLIYGSWANSFYNKNIPRKDIFGPISKLSRDIQAYYYDLRPNLESFLALSSRSDMKWIH